MHTDLRGISLPPVFSPGPVTGTGVFPDIDHYLAGSLLIRDPEAFDQSAPSPVQLDGRKVLFVEWKARTPFKLWEPHTIAEVHWWIDSQRHVPLKGEAIDPDGQIVSRISFQDVSQVAGERWVALTAITEVAPGRLRASYPVLIKEGSAPLKERQMTDSFPYPGRRYERRFQWLPEGILVPKETKVYDGDGNLLYDLEFDHYVVNVGVPDAVFEFRGPSATVAQ
jgi:hypothetical protein